MTMQPLRPINIESLLAPHPPRTNFNLFSVDAQYTVRVAKVRGAFPWHVHPESDEGWVVYRGKIRIRSEAGDIELSSGEAAMVPRGLRHSPLALEDESVVMIINGRQFRTVYTDAEMTDAHADYRELDVEPSGR